MLMFTRAMPWTFKAGTLCYMLTRTLSAGGATGRAEHVLVPVAFLTLASVLPSTLSSVVDRAKTTAYIMQSALFLLCMHAAVLALEHWDGQQYTLAVTQTCVMHMLCSQYRALVRHKHLLVYQGAVRCLLALMALMSWSACALMMPLVQVDIMALVGLMFAGEVVGVAVCFVAAVFLGVCDAAAAALDDRAL
jgi:hypothetical protein